MPVSLKSSGGGSVTLDVGSTASTYTLTLPSQTATVITDSAAALNIGSGQLYKDASGNVAVNTTSPQFKFNSIQGSATAAPSVTAAIQVYAKGFGGAGQQYAGIGFAMNEHTNGYWGSGVLARDDSGSYGAALSFYTSTGSATPSPTEQARISSSGVFSFNSGYGSSAIAYGCRAWANWDSTGAIRASGGTTSITKNATGNWTMNFNFTMVDANYSCQATCQRNTAAIGIAAIYGSATYNTLTTTTAQIMTREDSNTAIDPTATCVAIFR